MTGCGMGHLSLKMQTPVENEQTWEKQVTEVTVTGGRPLRGPPKLSLRQKLK